MADKKYHGSSSVRKRFKIWNGETSEFLGRTAAGWGKLLLFYVVFYAVLAAFCTVLFIIFLRTIDKEKPKRQLYDSIIGANPGIVYCPMAEDAATGGTLIRYNSSQLENMTYWHDTVNKFLEDYINPNNQENVDENCSDNRPLSEGKFCSFRTESLGNCSPERTRKTYGYPERRPCVFLKLNKIYNWYPHVFDETSIDELTDFNHRNRYKMMPEFLRQAIASTYRPRQRMIWVSCEGERLIDVENLGAVNYFPRRGFPAYYFPYKNVRGYQSPIVSVQFDRPKSGVSINIECKVWAKNIFYDVTTGRGSVRFKLMID